MYILMFLLIGAVSGWLAGKIMKGSGYGIFGDLLLGIFGGVIGGPVLRWFGLSFYGFFGSVFTCMVGAILLIALVRFLKRL